MVLRWIGLISLTAFIACSKSSEVSATPDPGQNSDAQPSGTPLRRLTNRQYQQSIAQVFGPSIDLPELAVTDLTVSGLTTAGSSSVGMPQRDAEGYMTAAYQISAQLTSDDYRPSWPCEPADITDAACAGDIVDRYAPKLYRRNLESAQRDDLTELFLLQAKKTNNPLIGVHDMFAAMLLSPSFLFRRNVRQMPDPTRWDAFTLADNLSFLLTDAPPDDALWQDAQDASLLAIEKVRAHAVRLLDDPRSQETLIHFLVEVLQLDAIKGAQKELSDYPPDLAQDLYSQALLTIQDLLLKQNSDFRDIFTSQEVFINKRISTLYQYPAAQGDDFIKIRYTGNDRAGLLGLPGISAMLSPSHRTSPTKRGIYIRSVFLCTPIPSPPATANTALVSDDANPQTMRQMMSEHAANPECASCHQLMDPLGFAMDDFDWLGRYRSNDHNIPLDLTGNLDGRSFVNTRTLGQALHDHPSVPTCFLSKFLHHASGIQPNLRDASFTAMEQNFAAGGYTLREMLLNYVSRAEFFQTL